MNIQCQSVFMPDSSHSSFPRLGAFFFRHGTDTLSQGISFFRKHGLSCVQIGDPLLSELVKKPEKIPETVRRFHDAGISVIGLAGYRNLVAVDRQKREENLAYLERCLELGPAFDGAVVATETGTRHPRSDWAHSPENATSQAWSLLEEAIGRLLEIAGRCGTTLALEGYVNNVLARLDQVDLLFRTFPSPRLGLMLDPYNYISRDLVPVADRVCEDFLNRYADRFVIAHLKDVAAQGAGGSGDRADLVGTPEYGTGVFPQQAYMRFLRDRRPDLPIVFEHLPDENLLEAITRFHALVGRPVPAHLNLS